MTKRTLLIALRLFSGLITLTAIGTQLAIHLQHGFNVLNFFSYFTNLSNLFAAIVLILGAFCLVKRQESFAANDLMRGAAVINMAVVGIVFIALLRDVDLGHLLPWVNALLHHIMPVVVLLDWLYAPPETAPGAKQMLQWQVFPLMYLIYIMVRGALIGWYPYPFLDPAKVGGYGTVTLYVLGLAATFLCVSWLLMAAARKRNGL